MFSCSKLLKVGSRISAFWATFEPCEFSQKILPLNLEIIFLISTLSSRSRAIKTLFTLELGLLDKFKPEKQTPSVLENFLTSKIVAVGIIFLIKVDIEKLPIKRLLILSPKKIKGDLLAINNEERYVFDSKCFKKLFTFKFINFNGKLELKFWPKLKTSRVSVTTLLLILAFKTALSILVLDDIKKQYLLSFLISAILLLTQLKKKLFLL